jgi:hypothetical protein
LRKSQIRFRFGGDIDRGLNRLEERIGERIEPHSPSTNARQNGDFYTKRYGIAGSKRQLWDDVRALFRSFVVSSLSALYAALASGFVKGRLELENSS